MADDAKSRSTRRFSYAFAGGSSAIESVTKMIQIPFGNKSRNSSSQGGNGGRTSGRTSVSNEEGFNVCSQQSILAAMDRFTRSVTNMNATVLVPSKLRDMDTAGKKLRCIPPTLTNTDLYSFYLMLKDAKTELLWGPGAISTPAVGAAAPTFAPIVCTAGAAFDGTSSNASSDGSLMVKHHVRQPSDESLRSLGSTASSSDPDTDSDIDSLMMDRESIDEHSTHLAAAFRHHLQGLYTILHQLSDSADYLSSRYQEEIDVSSL